MLKTTRLLLVGVAMAALVLMGFAPPTLAQSTQQEVSPSKPLGQLPQPTKLETKPLPPDAKGPAGGASNSASIVASEDPEGNLYVAE